MILQLSKKNKLAYIFDQISAACWILLFNSVTEKNEMMVKELW